MNKKDHCQLFLSSAVSRKEPGKSTKFTISQLDQTNGSKKDVVKVTQYTPSVLIFKYVHFLFDRSDALYSEFFLKLISRWIQIA